MPGYECKFVESVQRKYVCLICHLPMRRSMIISSCGHRFCDSCLTEYLSEGVFECPEDRLPLETAKIYPDDDMDRIIETFKVQCAHLSVGCRWTDKLALYKKHMESCRYNAVPCPSGCAAKLAKLNLKKHLTYDCPRRQVVCEYCKLEHRWEEMEGHKDICPYAAVYCENLCGTRLQRRFMQQHSEKECSKRKAPCQYCHQEVTFNTMQAHSTSCPKYPVVCPNRCDPAKFARDKLDSHLSLSCPSVTVPCTFADHGCTTQCPRYSLDTHLEEEVKGHLSLVCAVVKKQGEEMALLRKQLQTLTSNYHGTLLWRITNFQAKFAAAKRGQSVEVKSAPFYTQHCGYKLVLTVFFNGNGPGLGSHMSLYISLQPGDYDSILAWPFTLPVTFTLFDQREDAAKRINVRETFVPNPTWKSFQRPCSDRTNAGYGYPTFISHRELLHRGYIKNDTLFIKACVETARVSQATSTGTLHP